MMKLRSSRSVGGQDQSPFLPQTVDTSTRTRPKLRFDSPEKTEEWLASREKTDYTYSRSASYVVSGETTGYQVPIMSRVSQGSFLRDTSSPARHGQLQQEVSASPSRRSLRLAQKNTLNESSSRINQSQTRTVQVSRSTSISATHLQTASSHGHYGNEVASSDESMWPSSASTMMSSASHMASASHQGRGSGVTARSGLYHQVHQSRSREHSINHMYGLDANDESEISDTESSSAVTSGISRTSGRWSTTDHAHHTHHAQSSSSFSSILLLPVYLLVIIVSSVVSVVTTVIQTSYTSLARVIYGSSSAESVSMSHVTTSSVSSKLGSLFSSLIQLMSVALYRCVTYLMCVDVWWLIFTKRATLGLLGGLGSLLGLGSASQTDRSAAMTAAATLERERKRRSCCLCLLLLLGTLASSYLLLAAAPFLLAVVSRNETKTESPLHTVNEQLGLLLGRLGSDSSDDDGGAAAVVAGSGCLQCLKQDDLMALIGVMVKGQLGDLQAEVASQKQQILAMQQLRVDQDTQIHNLQDQINILIAQQGQPNDRTLLYLNSMEGQLTRVRGQLRNLQLSRLRGYQDVERDDVERSAVIAGLSGDLKTLTKEVNSLQRELEDFHSQHVLAVNKAKEESDHMSSDLHSLHVNMVSWEGLAVNVTFLETKLKGLLNDVEILKSDEGQNNAKLEELISRVNSFEAGFVDIKNEVRNLKSEFADLLALRDKREKEKSGAMDSSLDLLRNDLASFKTSYADTVESLSELQNKYQTLSTSLGGVQSDVKVLQTSVEDLSKRQVRTLVSDIEQLNTKLAKLDTDLSSLQVNFLTLQGTASGTVDKKGLESLHVSITQTEQQLNSLEIQVSQLRSQLDDVRTSHEEHRSQAGAALRELRSDIGELNIKSERMVVLENIQGNADSDTLFKQLSEELGAVRLDLRRVSSLEGDSDLVTEVTNLRSSLTDAKSQINYFDTTQMQMTRTFTSSLSDVRDGIGQINRELEDQSAAMGHVNATVISLKQGQDKLAAFATRKQLEEVEVEMASVKAMIDRLSAAQSIYASTGDINALKTQLTDIKVQVDNTQVRLTEMSNTYVSDSASYSALAADLAKLQSTVSQLEMMLYNADQQPINLSALESRINSLTSILDDNDENLAAFLAAGGIRGSAGSHDAIIALQQDLTAVRSDTDRLMGLLFPQREGSETTNALAALLDRVAAAETNIAQLKAAGVGASGGYDVKFQQLRGEINNLKEDVMRQNVLHSTDAGLGVMGAAMQDDMNEAKANITRLQVDVYRCCSNKTGLLGWWMSPWFSGGQGSAGSTLNLSASGTMDDERVRSIVLSALSMYSADKTGMVDYALESAGGSVISTRCSETHYSKTALLSIFGIPLWYMANSPRTVIQPDVQPGNCWAFKGSQGYIVIQLAGIIKPSAFSMEHIPKSLSPTGTIDSAPKEFSVWGLENEEDTEGVLLGEYVYDQDGSPLQFFPIEKDDVEPIPAVELKIHSNHGNLEYTCLYRFRVHGTLDRR